MIISLDRSTRGSGCWNYIGGGQLTEKITVVFFVFFSAVSFETLSSEVGRLTFSVDATVSGFDFVALHIEDPTLASLVPTIMFCHAGSELGLFAGGNSYSCDVPGLSANTVYNISLLGHNDEFSSPNGLTNASDHFIMTQGRRLYETLRSLLYSGSPI